jgi:hypothetical protein
MAFESTMGRAWGDVGRGCVSASKFVAGCRMSPLITDWLICIAVDYCPPANCERASALVTALVITHIHCSIMALVISIYRRSLAESPQPGLNGPMRSFRGNGPSPN